MEQEHLEAWTKIKRHLTQHQENLMKSKGLSEASDSLIDDLIEDIDYDVQKIEEVFICSVGL